jgi:hypothetical protein
MNIGDLVRYKYLQNDLGLIVEVKELLSKARKVKTFKVMWFGPTANQISEVQWDWMREEGLEVISASR